MIRRCPYPVAKWPWPIRWSVGMTIGLLLVVPICVGAAIYQSIRDGIESFWDSEAWNTITVSFLGIIFGTTKNHE
jgi:hypothetical protein